MLEINKSDMWLFVVNKSVLQKVVFDQPVSAKQAIRMYGNNDYEDILDEQDLEESDFRLYNRG